MPDIYQLVLFDDAVNSFQWQCVFQMQPHYQVQCKGCSASLITRVSYHLQPHRAWQSADSRIYPSCQDVQFRSLVLKFFVQAASEHCDYKKIKCLEIFIAITDVDVQRMGSRENSVCSFSLKMFDRENFSIRQCSPYVVISIPPDSLVDHG